MTTAEGPEHWKHGDRTQPLRSTPAASVNPSVPTAYADKAPSWRCRNAPSAHNVPSGAASALSGSAHVHMGDSRPSVADAVCVPPGSIYRDSMKSCATEHTQRPGNGRNQGSELVDIPRPLFWSRRRLWRSRPHATGRVNCHGHQEDHSKSRGVVCSCCPQFPTGAACWQEVDFEGHERARDPESRPPCQSVPKLDRVRQNPVEVGPSLIQVVLVQIGPNPVEFSARGQIRAVGRAGTEVDKIRVMSSELGPRLETIELRIPPTRSMGVVRER